MQYNILFIFRTSKKLQPVMVVVVMQVVMVEKWISSSKYYFSRTTYPAQMWSAQRTVLQLVMKKSLENELYFGFRAGYVHTAHIYMDENCWTFLMSDIVHAHILINLPNTSTNYDQSGWIFCFKDEIRPQYITYPASQEIWFVNNVYLIFSILIMVAGEKELSKWFKII